MKNLLLISTFIVMILFGPFSYAQDKEGMKQQDPSVSEKDEHRPGLVGVVYLGPDFKRPKCGHLIDSVNQIFDLKTGFGNDWSAKWHGTIKAPVTGQVTLQIKTSQKVYLEVDGERLFEVQDGIGSGSLKMVESESFPITIGYSHFLPGKSIMRLEWSWPDHDAELVPIESVTHTLAQEDYWNWRPEPDPESIDHSKFIKAKGKHAFVCNEPGRYAAWPANQGIWIWGNEILVGLTHAYHAPNSGGGHSYDRSKPSKEVLARSLDGGKTWQLEDPNQYIHGRSDKKLTEPIQFDHPDFAMRCIGDRYYFSYDRGRTWQGQYRFPKFSDNEMTSRTDYIVDGPKTCTVFLSAKDKSVQVEEFSDRVFCARTSDGGLTWKFLSWVTGEPYSVRSVMPSTARISPNHLVTTMRRRIDQGLGGERPPIPENWIDAYESKDNGKSWTFLSKVADTDRGRNNGNPPAMVRLRDGRLVVAHGYRSIPYGIQARISKDNGATWSDAIHLRDDGYTWDMGYCRMVERPDGKLVTIYYYNTTENIAQHIAVTIWDPEDLILPGKETLKRP